MKQVKTLWPKEVEAAAESAQDKLADLNQKAAAAIVAYIDKQGLDTSALQVSFDGASSTVSVAGTVADQATKEKRCCCAAATWRASIRWTTSSPSPTPSRRPLSHRRARRHPVGDRQGLLWQRQRLHEDLRGQQADAERPEQDLPGPGAAHSGLISGFADWRIVSALTQSAMFFIKP